MDKSKTAYPIDYRPLQIAPAAALFVYMFLLLYVTFGGAVASLVWWLVLLLPISGVLAHFATRRILWRQISYVVTGAALTLTGSVAVGSVFAALAPNAQIFIVAGLTLSVISMGLWGYIWAKRGVSIGKNGFETRIRARNDSAAQEQIVVPRRRGSIHNVSLPVKILAASAMISGAIKLMSVDSKMALLGLSALIFAWGGAWLSGHTLYAMVLTRAWERQHRVPLLADIPAKLQRHRQG